MNPRNKPDSPLESLGLEIKLEMARNFFGARRQVENEAEALRALAHKARDKQSKALRRAATLGVLLLDQGAPFYARIGVDPGPLLTGLDDVQPSPAFRVPWALTAPGRYGKALLQAYSRLQDAVDEHLHSRWVKDEETPGKKRLSPSYELVKRLHAQINERIDEVNSSQSPSAVLGLSKRMDIGAKDYESSVGGTLDDFAPSLDESMRLPLVEWESLGLLELPDLPGAEQLAGEIRRFGKDIYRSSPDKARQALTRLKELATAP